jgi:hypothetical protein
MRFAGAMRELGRWTRDQRQACSERRTKLEQRSADRAADAMFEGSLAVDIAGSAARAEEVRAGLGGQSGGARRQP